MTGLGFETLRSQYLALITDRKLYNTLFDKLIKYYDVEHFQYEKKKRIKVCPRGNEGETSNGEEVMGTLVFLFGQYCEKKKGK